MWPAWRAQRACGGRLGRCHCRCCCCRPSCLVLGPVRQGHGVQVGWGGRDAGGAAGRRGRYWWGGGRRRRVGIGQQCERTSRTRARRRTHGRPRWGHRKTICIGQQRRHRRRHKRRPMHGHRHRHRGRLGHGRSGCWWGVWREEESIRRRRGARQGRRSGRCRPQQLLYQLSPVARSPSSAHHFTGCTQRHSVRALSLSV
jgi:hypothetical protein